MLKLGSFMSENMILKEKERKIERSDEGQYRESEKKEERSRVERFLRKPCRKDLKNKFAF